MQHHVEPHNKGERLDIWLSRMCPDHSRARLQAWIKEGHVQVDGRTCKPNHTLTGQETVVVQPPATVDIALEPEAIPLDVLYEDAEIIALNKPPGLVVHPAPGHPVGTLVNALLHHCPDLTGIGGERRPGIVHRLDMDTSGVMVVAKTDQAMSGLSDQFKQRTVRKEYLALVRGHPSPPTGVLETLIGRSTGDRKKMSAHTQHGRTARTRYETIETYAAASLLRVHIETGRTHQIRVHMTHLGHPIWGDATYGRARTLPGGEPVPRQMLHAAHLAITHPTTKQPLEFTAPIPEDMRAIIQILRTSSPGTDK